MRGRRRWGLLAALVVIVAAGTGCDPNDEFGVRTRLASFGAHRYVEFTSTKDDGRISLDTCICFFPDGSFDLVLEAGDFRGIGESVLGGATGGFEFAPRGVFPPVTFTGASLRFINGGTQTYTYDNASAPNVLASAFFPATRRVHFRAQRNDTGLLSYFVRPTVNDAWTPLGSTTLGGATDRLSLSLGMFNAPKKAQIGFSGLRIDGIGSLPPIPTTELSLEHASYATLADLYDEYYALEDFLEENADIPPEFLFGLDQDLEELDEILDLIEDFEDPLKRPSRQAKMRSAVTKERKLLAKAAGLIREGKAKKALGPLGDAMKLHLGWIGTMRSGG